MAATTQPKRSYWKGIVFVAVLAVAGLTYAGTKPAIRWDSPLKPRAKLVNTLQRESVLELIENLPNFDDTVWAMGSMNMGSMHMEDSYLYLRDYVPRLNRVRKIVAEWKSDSDGVRRVLKQKFQTSVETYEQFHIAMSEALVAAGGALTVTEPDNCDKQAIYGKATTYLLEETNIHDALPLMAKAYSSGRKLPMSRLFLFYAMHLLALDHPRNHLSAPARTALEDYLRAAKDVPPPSLREVAAWNSAVEETDFRITILHTDIGLERQPLILLRIYPLELQNWEVMWTRTMSPEVTTLYTKLAAFIAEAYPER